MREKISKAQSASKLQFIDSETTENIRKKKRWSNSDEGGALNHWSTFCERKQRLTAKLNNRSKLVTCKTTGTGKSTANDESYDDSAATTE